MEKSFNMLTFYDFFKNESVVVESKKLREHFYVKILMQRIFEAVLEALNTHQSDWTKDVQDYDLIRRYQKVINEFATILAGMSRSRKRFKLSSFKKSTYDVLKRDFLRKYVNDYFEVSQQERITYVEKTFNELIKLWMKRWKIEHGIDNLPCRDNVTVECSQMKSMYYNLVALPLILRESQMGFGTFLSFFLRLFSGEKAATRPVEIFLKNEYNSEENVIQKSMIKVLNALNDAADRESDISGFELVKLLHQNPDESQKMFLTRLQVKYDCKGNDELMIDLDSAWTKFVNEEIKENISPCQNVSFYMDQFGISNYTRCCELFDLVRFQSKKAVLKLMKYSIQPAAYFEPLDDFLVSYDNLDFLDFNNLTNHTSDFFNRQYLYATKYRGNSKSPIFLRLAPINTFSEKVK